MILIGTVGTIRLRKNPETAKQQDIEAADERNIKIREKSAYSTFFITLLTFAAAMAIFVLQKNAAAVVVINIFMAVHVFSYLMLLRINSNRM